MNSIKHSLLLVICIFLLASCMISGNQSEINEATLTQSITPSNIPVEQSQTELATNSPSPTASLTLTASPFPTATEILETPDFFASTIADNILFAPSADPDCQLPCWQGLTVGKSDQDDALQMFDEVFGLKVSDNFFQETPMEPLRDDETPSIKYARYGWEFPSGTFNISVAVDKETLFIIGFQITHSSRPRKLYLHTPQEIMQHVGSPSEIYIEPEIKSGGDTYLIRLMLVYNEGMAFWFHQEVSEVQQAEVNYINLCFNNTVILSTYTFVEPFDSLEGDLDPVQTEWIQRFALRTVLEPSEEVLGMTAEEIGAVAVQEENPCILMESDYLNQ